MRKLGTHQIEFEQCSKFEVRWSSQKVAGQRKLANLDEFNLFGRPAMMTAVGDEDGAEQGEINAENNNILPQTSKEKPKEAENEATCNGVSLESSQLEGLTKVLECENCAEIVDIQRDFVPEVQVEPAEAIASELEEPESAESDASEPESRSSLGSEVGGEEAAAPHQDQMCQTSPPRPSLVVLNLLRRLSEQEAANEQLRLEKDRQLRDITSSLLVFEGQLRREQERIGRLLKERDARIAEQEKHIQALLRLNRRLAAKRCRSQASVAGGEPEEQRGGKKKSKRQQRRISWHNEVFVITDYDKHWTQIRGQSGMGEMKRIEDYGRERQEEDKENCGGKISAVSGEGSGACRTLYDKEVDDVCESVNMLVKGVSSDPDSPLMDLDRLAFPAVIGPPAGGEVDAAEEDPSRDNAADGTGQPGLQDPPNLGVFYNRVMSNHRSVTKPKDVKYKKISRVKSRSLEELRGRLRKQPPSLSFPAYPLLLESSEETP